MTTAAGNFKHELDKTIRYGHSRIHLGYGSTATAVPHTYGTEVMSCEGRLSSRVSDNGYPSLYVFFESKLQKNNKMISAAN